jgi:CRP-like cAMP-binding protein
MARMIGATPETFSRVLRAFSRRGVVGLRRDRIQIRDLNLLQSLAGEQESG